MRELTGIALIVIAVAIYENFDRILVIFETWVSK
jgi:hypothetical protein